MTTHAPTTKGSRVWLKRIAVAVWAPVAAELFLRLLAPVALMPRYVVASPYGIRVNQPSVTYWQRTPEVAVKLSINSQGIRADREIPLQKPPGVVRIVGLGDSFGMGYEVALEETFWAVAERELQAKGVQAQFVNLSVSGHGTAEELVMLRTVGFEFQPDLVVVAWGGSDLEDNQRSKLFRVDSGRVVPDQTVYLPGTAVQEFLGQFSLYRLISERCQLYSFVRETVAGEIKKTLLLLRSTGTTHPVNPTLLAHGDALDASQELAIALLSEMQRDCTTRGVPLLVLDLPGERDGVIESRFPDDPLGQDFGLRLARVDDSFVAHRNEPLFRRQGHGHYTPRGYELVGMALAEAIQRLLAESLQARPSDSGPTVESRGDLSTTPRGSR